MPEELEPEGTTLGQWPAEYFRERAERVDMEAFRQVLNRAGGEPPRPGDELPE